MNATPTRNRLWLALAGLLCAWPVGGHTQVFISEILADPPNDLAGDANGDGVRDTFADEFVELFNAGTDTLSLEGWRLGDDDTSPAHSFVFPAGTRLAPGGYLVLFGGGTPTGLSVPVFTDDGRIGDGLSNGGDTVFLISAQGDTVDAVYGAGWPADRSVVRSAGGVFVAHGDPPGQGESFSPGRAGLAAAPPPAPPHQPGRSPYTSIRIEEILADPPADLAGDANGDGVRDTFADEFVELFNAGTDTLSLEGWRLGDDDTAFSAFFRFPAGTRLAPGGYLVLFGGGTPTGFSVPVFTDDGRIGDGLSNGGDMVLLFDAAGDTVDAVAGRDWPAHRSVLRGAGGVFIAHGDPPGQGESYSPGRAGLSAAPPANPPGPTTAPSSPPHLPPVPLLFTEILADPPGDTNGDGRADRSEDEFVELFNPGPDLDLSGWRLSDDDTPPERQFRFPAGTVLRTGQYLVLFGGGTPPPLAGVLVFADDGTIGDGLANSGDRLLLIGGPAADTLLSLTYASKPDLNQSLSCEGGPPCLPHGQLPGRAPFSPGGPRPLYTGFRLDSLSLVAEQSDTLALHGEFPGGSEAIDPSRVLWHVEDPRPLRVDRNGVAKGLKPGRTTVDAWVPELFLASAAIRVQAPPPPPPPPNQPPRFVSLPDTLAYVGSHYHCSLQAEDPERSTLIYTPTQLPAWLAWAPASRTLFGRAPSQPGSALIAVEVDDGQGGLASLSYILRLVPLPEVRFSEVLSDPPPGLAGDANGDGQRHSQADEFVELHNQAAAAVELGGWVLAGENITLFRFPANTLLPPGARAVVFGDEAPQEPWFFSAGGQLGQGLNNRQGALYLIDPAGPDTLARAAYRLDRDPDQSLCWPAEGGPPLLHGQWPGREPFSPGKPRPQLQTLSLDPPRLLLTSGESAQLKVVGRYSDGLQQELHLAGQWRTSAPAIASLKGQGAVIAADTGRARISVQFDTFAASCQVVVQHPLPRRVEFSPSLKRFAAPPGLPLSFAVRSLTGEALDCSWAINGRPQQTRAQHLVHFVPWQRPDTIEVEVRVRRETHTHRWLLQPGTAQPRQPDTLIAAGPLRPRNHPNPFNASTHIRFQLPAGDQAPVVRLCDLAGQLVRQLQVHGEAAGWYRAFWDGLDGEGRPAASGIYLYIIESNAQRQLGKLLLLR